ncbi:hypothetical protein BS47DRAFT_1344918, partial [Hydnum rufescens UP504]
MHHARAHAVPCGGTLPAAESEAPDDDGDGYKRTQVRPPHCISPALQVLMYVTYVILTIASWALLMTVARNLTIAHSLVIKTGVVGLQDPRHLYEQTSPYSLFPLTPSPHIQLSISP